MSIGSIGKKLLAPKIIVDIIQNGNPSKMGRDCAVSIVRVLGRQWSTAKVKRLVGAILAYSEAGYRAYAKELRKYIGIFIIGLLLSGCATTTRVFYPDGTDLMIEIVRVEQGSEGLVEYDPTTKKVTVDTRKENWWQGNLLPFFTGLADRAAEAR